MLWYKAWRESRARFVLGATVLSLYCISFVRGAQHSFPPIYEPNMPYSVFVWHGIYRGPVVAIFVMLALALGLGGLQRERSAGTAAFTLSLPVSRISLVGGRALMALGQVNVLAIVPAIWVPSPVLLPRPVLS